ncbi:MAG: hypothetical protein N2485_00600 [bacterium]|nr:hypothetical protein [bacterium]
MLRNEFLSIIINLEKLILFLPTTAEVVTLYLKLIKKIIEQNYLYNYVPLYLNFVLEVNNYVKWNLNNEIRWVFKRIFKNVDDLFIRSQLCYMISKIYLELKKYNKAQAFAVRAFNYLSIYLKRNNNKENKTELYIYILRIYLIIAKLAFYRRKFDVSLNILDYLVKEITEEQESNIKELISILIESLILMTTISIYQNYNLDKIKEILSAFLDIVQSFINYIDLQEVKENYYQFVIKNLDFLKKIEKNHSKYLKNYLDSKNIIKKRTKKSNAEKRLIEIKKHVEQVYLELDNLFNYNALFLSLYKDYIIKYMSLYPDNYKLALKYAWKAFFIADRYLLSPSLITISKFLAFKVLENQQLFNNLEQYLKEVNIQEYINNNKELNEDILKDISNKKLLIIK